MDKDALTLQEREAWAELPEVDSLAAEELAGETFEHYEEHVPDLERFVG